MAFHDSIRDGDGWETLESREVYANPHVEVRLVRRKTPTRPESASWTVVHRKAACVVAPVTEGGNFLLVRQERIPICAQLWEFPAGQIDTCSEHTPEVLRETALRELEEESGYELAPGGELLSLGHFFPSAGVMDELSHLFLARPVAPGVRGARHDEHEAITECREFTPAQLRAMIAEGEIRDANTLAAYARMCARGLL